MNPAESQALATGTKKNWILLRSGAAYVFGEEECPALKFEEDVVVPLSRIARYIGHTNTQPWSVAAHAACCAIVARDAGLAHRIQRLVLHHDDAEALVGDCASPLKRQLKEFAGFEDAAYKAIAKHTGVEPANQGEVMTIKAVDLALLEGERRLLKAPLVPGMNWGVPFDERLADLAEKTVYRALKTYRSFGDNAHRFYMNIHAALEAGK